MQKTRSFRAFALVSYLALFGHVEAQVSQPNNNPTPGSYVGHSGLNGNPVEVRHNGNEPIQWFTDSIQRMQLYRSQVNTINGFPSIVQNGYLGISQQPLFFSNTVGPFSRLHLVDSTSNSAVGFAQQIGFRPWQRNGVTFTGNSDQAYIGHKYTTNANGVDLNDRTDLVLQWSDNPEDSPWGTDRLRFLFTSWAHGAPYGARSTEGLESVRVYIPNDTSAFVGIGDWNKASVIANSTIDPTERLDVLDRTIRIQRLIPDYNNDTLTRVVMVDSTGRLHWRRIDSWPSDPGGGTDDCEWSMTTGANNHVYTAVGLADPDCPDDGDAVYIGLLPGSAPASRAKLNVQNNSYLTTTNSKIGLNVEVTGDPATRTRGIVAYSNGATSTGYAGDFISQDSANFTVGIAGQARNGILESIGVQGFTWHSFATNNWGVQGRNRLTATSGPAVLNFIGVEGITRRFNVFQRAFGVRGRILEESPDPPADTMNYQYAIYGSAPVRAKSWAGFFQGDVQITGGLWNGTTWIFSDASLKTEVEEIENAGEVLLQLQPKRYS